MKAIICAVLCLLALPLGAKDKKAVLPDFVLKADTIAVVVDPDAGVSLTNPGENNQAREAVEAALRKWGRYRVLAFPDQADLIVSVRRGHEGAVRPTIAGRPNDRPTTIDPGSRGPDGSMSTTIGISHGTPPPISQIPPPPTGAQRTEVGSSEDTFVLYRGNGGTPGRLENDYPLDTPPLWRYSGKNALVPPGVKAVDEFQKAVDESAKAQQKKP